VPLASEPGSGTWTSWAVDRLPGTSRIPPPPPPSPPGDTSIAVRISPDQVWNVGGPGPSDDEVYFAATEARTAGRVGDFGDFLLSIQTARGTWAPWYTPNHVDAGTSYATHLMGGFQVVSLAVANGDLQICAVASDRSGGRTINPLWQVSREKSEGLGPHGTYRRWLRLKMVPGHGEGFQDVSCAGVRNPQTGVDDLHVVAMTKDGQLWHTIARGPLPTSRTGSPATWTEWDNLGARLGIASRIETESWAYDIAASPTPGVLNLVAVGSTGGGPPRLLHFVRFASGNWSPGTDLFAGAPTKVATPPRLTGTLVRVSIAACQHGVSAGRQHLAIALLSSPGIYFTIASTSREDWDGSELTGATYIRPWEDLAALSGFRSKPSPIGITITERPFAP